MSQPWYNSYPVSPASPRDILTINANKIHSDIIDTETTYAEAHATRYRANQERKLVLATQLRGGRRPPPRAAWLQEGPPEPPGPRIYPTSSAGQRIHGGCTFSAPRHRTAPAAITPSGKALPRGVTPNTLADSWGLTEIEKEQVEAARQQIRALQAAPMHRPLPVLGLTKNKYKMPFHYGSALSVVR